MQSRIRNKDGKISPTLTPGRNLSKSHLNAECISCNSCSTPVAEECFPCKPAVSGFLTHTTCIPCYTQPTLQRRNRATFQPRHLFPLTIALCPHTQSPDPSPSNILITWLCKASKYLPSFLFPYCAATLTQLALPVKGGSLLKHQESSGPTFISVVRTTAPSEEVPLPVQTHWFIYYHLQTQNCDRILPKIHTTFYTLCVYTIKCYVRKYTHLIIYNLQSIQDKMALKVLI